jgi:hypothetical protein
MIMKLPFLKSSLVIATVVLQFTSAFAQNPLPEIAKANTTQAIQNARQIGMMLFEFDNDYGSFPSEKTLADVEKIVGEKLPVGDKASNTLFRQLFAAGITENETPFFANIPGVMKGREQEKPEKALTKGKNAFAYIAGLNTADNPNRPVVVCPLIPGTTKFDPKPFGGKAIILRIDCSVQVLSIEEDGTVLQGGVELLSKDHPIWKDMDGKALDIRYPDLAAEG